MPKHTRKNKGIRHIFQFREKETMFLCRLERKNQHATWLVLEVISS